MALHRLTSKFIINGSHTLLNNAWFCRGFVSATAPSHKEKIDKETCEKIIETAETVKDGSKDVVKEVKRVGEAITEKVTNATGNMVADAAKKGFERAAETADTKKSKDLLDTGKVVAEALKEKVEKKD
ncbi:uncharacterized protein LOC131001270 [Salvia miltiorrhiza]|uniref:uncharacterized protein LOC131001270 n=1 Tax=Salvia miltiorrhiza TaxID=226208 RepID=UPI0025ABEF27|nr:uncharacterized protein LOC131001270 [Salvia miltiorrhiza]